MLLMYEQVDVVGGENVHKVIWPVLVISQAISGN